MFVSSTHGMVFRVTWHLSILRRRIILWPDLQRRQYGLVIMTLRWRDTGLGLTGQHLPTKIGPKENLTIMEITRTAWSFTHHHQRKNSGMTMFVLSQPNLSAN